jgi:hypothetical protein
MFMTVRTHCDPISGAKAFCLAQNLRRRERGQGGLTVSQLRVYRVTIASRVLWAYWDFHVIFGHLHLTLILDQPHDPIFLWLVVYLPSEKYEFVSWDYDIPNIWKVIKAMFQTTNQFLMTGQSPARCAP